MMADKNTIHTVHTRHTYELVNIKNLQILDVKQTKKLPHTLLQRLMTEYEIINNNLKIRHFYNKLKQSTKHIVNIVGMKQNV